MYTYSLTWFINLYHASIAGSRHSKDVTTRIKNINDHFTKSIYRNVCRSVFEKHKLVFSFVLCIVILKSKGEIREDIWNFLLTGGVALDNFIPNPASDWLSDKSWTEIVRLSKLPGFENLVEHVKKYVKQWKQLYDSPEPQDAKFPDPWNELDDFSKLVILRCFRPERLVPAIQQFIVEKLG